MIQLTSCATTLKFKQNIILNTFETLLEIKTAKKNLSLKAIYIKHPSKKLKWTFYIYYFDKISHSLHINWINKKTISESSLEEIINRVFKKEENKNKKPSVFYFSMQDDIVYIDRVKLKAQTNKKWEIRKLLIDNSKLYS